MCTNFLLESLMGGDHLEDMHADGSIILKWIFGKEGVDWIHVVHNRDWWMAFVIKVMHFRVP
jgi:hypothetical protein